MVDIISNVFLCICIPCIRHCLYIKIIQILSIILQGKYYHSRVMNEKNKAQKC